MASWQSYVFLFAFVCMIDFTNGHCTDTLKDIFNSTQLSTNLVKRIPIRHTKKPENMLACSLYHNCKDENCEPLLNYCLWDDRIVDNVTELCDGNNSGSVSLLYLACVIQTVIENPDPDPVCDNYDVISEIHSKLLTSRSFYHTTTPSTTTLAATATATNTSSSTTTHVTTATNTSPSTHAAKATNILTSTHAATATATNTSPSTHAATAIATNTSTSTHTATATNTSPLTHAATATNTSPSTPTHADTPRSTATLTDTTTEMPRSTTTTKVQRTTTAHETQDSVNGQRSPEISRFSDPNTKYNILTGALITSLFSNAVMLLALFWCRKKHSILQATQADRFSLENEHALEYVSVRYSQTADCPIVQNSATRECPPTNVIHNQVY